MSRLTDYENPNSLGSRMRRRRLGPLLRLIQETYARNGSARILDIGGRELYWNLLPEGFLFHHNAHVTILNITAPPEPHHPYLFTHQAGDACDLSEWPDRSFDIVHSNSVIEHVGSWENMKAFAKEANRLGDALFIQTPYFWFPVEPHFICPFYHWLPWPIRASLHRRFPLGSKRKAQDLSESISFAQAAPLLLDQKSYRWLFPDTNLKKERFFLFTKSLVAFREGSR